MPLMIRDVALAGDQTCSLLSDPGMCTCAYASQGCFPSQTRKHVAICSGISIQTLGRGNLLLGLARDETATLKTNGEGRWGGTVAETLINTVCWLPSRVLRAGPVSFPWIVAAGPGDAIHTGPRRGSHARGSMSILSQSQLLQFCAIRYVPTLSTCTSMQCSTAQWKV